MRPDAGVRAAREDVASSEGVDIAPLADLLESEGAALRPLFGVNEERIRAKTSALAAETGEDVPALAVTLRKPNIYSRRLPAPTTTIESNRDP
jgi:hypothetical protein